MFGEIIREWLYLSELSDMLPGTTRSPVPLGPPKPAVPGPTQPAPKLGARVSGAKLPGPALSSKPPDIKPVGTPHTVARKPLIPKPKPVNPATMKRSSADQQQKGAESADPDVNKQKATAVATWG